jgi:hypothetical protein
MPSRGLSRALGMTGALRHADEDDGMPHKLPILRVKTHWVSFAERSVCGKC